MLKSLEGNEGFELKCGSHVDRLLGKLPPRDSFVEFCINNKILQADLQKTYNLSHLTNWLQTKARAKRIASHAAVVNKVDLFKPEKKAHYINKSKELPTSAFYSSTDEDVSSQKPNMSIKNKVKPFCPYCNSEEH